MPFHTLAAALPLIAITGALAQPLTTAFTYQGDLRSAGAPADGPHDFRFRLYDAVSGGSQLGPTACSFMIDVDEGRFTVKLDFGARFSGQQQFLEIDVRAHTGLNCSNGTGFITLSPRQSVTAAPNALFALGSSNAAQLNGQAPAFYQNAGNLASGTIPSARLSGTYSGSLTFSNAANAFAGAFNGTHLGNGSALTGVNAELLDGLDSSAFLQAIPLPLTLSGPSPTHVIRGENTTPSGFTYGVYGQSASTIGAGVFGRASASGGNSFGVVGESASPSGSGVYGTGGATGVFGESAISGVLGRSGSPTGEGITGLATHLTGVNFGGSFESMSSSGRGVHGVASSLSGNSYGGYFETSSTSGRGVFGVATAATGTNYGLYGRSQSTSGRGVYGVASTSTGRNYGGYFETFSPDGYAVYGRTGAQDGTAIRGVADLVAGKETYGVHGVSWGDSGVGVFGQAHAATGFTAGGVFVSDSASGRGVIGVANSATGYGGMFSNNGASRRTVELAGPNGAFNTTGFVNREYTAGTPRCAIPIAYGSISPTGAIDSGTGNFTVARVGVGQYDITITGESYSNTGYTVTITPISNSPRFTAVADAGTAMRVNIWTASAVAVDDDFHFTVWKADAQ